MPRKSQKNSSAADQHDHAKQATYAMSAADEPKSSRDGQNIAAVKAKRSVPARDETHSLVSDLPRFAEKAIESMSDASEPNPSAVDPTRHVDQASHGMSAVDGTIAALRALHRERCFAMEQRKRSDLALGAFLRTTLGWRKDAPEAERKAIAERAGAIMKDPTGSEWQEVIAAAIGSRAPFAALEKQTVKQMEELAETLPVWADFGADVRGFGRASLAVIVAEAGNLSNYSNHSKLWKRMGLAVLDGVRQGGLSKGAGADAWIAHGYNRQRRSRMWNIGDTLIKGNRTGKYRTLYLARKEFEIARCPDIRPIVAHRRAQRYMEKRLLRDLWQAWRRTRHGMRESANLRLSDAPFCEAAE